MKIDKAETRKLPRKFEFPWGRGMITEEASIRCTLTANGLKERWEPTIQLLKFENGESALRFCVYSKGRLRRKPMILDDAQARMMASEIKVNRKLKAILRNLLM